MADINADVRQDATLTEAQILAGGIKSGQRWLASDTKRTITRNNVDGLYYDATGAVYSGGVWVGGIGLIKGTEDGKTGYWLADDDRTLKLDIGSGAVDLSTGAEGSETGASGTLSHAEGSATTASGGGSHAEGNETTASGMFSHAEGYRTTASGADSHAEGSATTAIGDYSHAEGFDSTAPGVISHAEGYDTTASGGYSHAEGNGTTASVQSSHAEGQLNTITTDAPIGAHVEGQYAIDVTTDQQSVIGIGIDNANRKNGRIMWTDGTMELPECTNAAIEARGPKAVVTKEYVGAKSHDSLTGVNDAEAGVSKGHITDQAQTIAGAKTFSSAITTPTVSSNELTTPLKNLISAYDDTVLVGNPTANTAVGGVQVSIGDAFTTGIDFAQAVEMTGAYTALTPTQEQANATANAGKELMSYGGYKENIQQWPTNKPAGDSNEGGWNYMRRVGYRSSVPLSSTTDINLVAVPNTSPAQSAICYFTVRIHANLYRNALAGVLEFYVAYTSGSGGAVASEGILDTEALTGVSFSIVLSADGQHIVLRVVTGATFTPLSMPIIIEGTFSASCVPEVTQ